MFLSMLSRASFRSLRAAEQRMTTAPAHPVSTSHAITTVTRTRRNTFEAGVSIFLVAAAWARAWELAWRASAQPIKRESRNFTLRVVRWVGTVRDWPSIGITSKLIRTV